jgi:hypothetical protein
MEAGMDRESAEAAVLGSELECDTYHVGSDSGRVALWLKGEEDRLKQGTETPPLPATVTGGGAAADASAAGWAVCVDLETGHPRGQATLLVVLPRDGTAAQCFRDAQLSAITDTTSEAGARAAVTALMESTIAASLRPALAEAIRAALHSS